MLNGAAYMIDWDNFYTVLYDLLTVPFNFRRNVGGSTIQGVELDMVARINTNWTLTGGLAYNIAELEGDFATIAPGSAAGLRRRRAAAGAHAGVGVDARPPLR